MGRRDVLGAGWKCMLCRRNSPVTQSRPPGAGTHHLPEALLVRHLGHGNELVVRQRQRVALVSGQCRVKKGWKATLKAPCVCVCVCVCFASCFASCRPGGVSYACRRHVAAEARDAKVDAKQKDQRHGGGALVGDGRETGGELGRVTANSSGERQRRMRDARSGAVTAEPLRAPADTDRERE